MPQIRCVICGAHENDVEKLHYFPTNPEKLKLWQEKLGITYEGACLRNRRICCAHFSDESYVNLTTRRLHKDAVPIQDTAVITHMTPEDNRAITPEPIEMKQYAPEPIQIKHTTPEPVASTSGIQRKTPLFRSIPGVSKIKTTPRKERLIKLVESKESHIRKLKKLCKQRANNIKALYNLSESKAVRNIFQDMPSLTSKFLISQIRCAKTKPKGRRWTTDEKVTALALYKRSPRCYSLLRKFVALPARKTLFALLQRVPFEVGINEHLFKHIKEYVTTEEGKCCVLLFDEMDIKEHIEYNTSSDRIVGFEEFGLHLPSNKWANRALVFMLQGLAQKWKQPVAYYFSNNGCPAETLKTLIKEVVCAAQSLAGLTVVATICDMGSTNVKALKEMGSSLQNPYISIEGCKIYTMFDPPHLLKCTVSLFRKHNVCLPVAIGGRKEVIEAKFSDIVKAYEIDKNSPLVFRAMHKLKERHLAPIMKYSMKVNIAAQVMSRTVAAFIYVLLSRGELEQRSIATATFIQEVDELFDSFNGSQPMHEGKQLKCFITENSPHIQYWINAFQTVKSWTFQRRKKSGNIREDKPPSQVGWLISIKAIMLIWEYLHSEKGFSSLRPRSLNQDALENLFGGVRSGCGSNDNPTARQFAASLKTQILNGLTNRSFSGGNCAEDDHIILSNLRSFLYIEHEEMSVETAESDPARGVSDAVSIDIADAVATGSVHSVSVAYVSGYIAKRLLQEMKCEICTNLLLSTSEAPHNIFIVHKEWSETEKLQYPSQDLAVAVGHCITLLENMLENLTSFSNVGTLAARHMKDAVSFSHLSCSAHTTFIADGITKAICRIGIPWWCKRKNSERKQAKKENQLKKIKKFKHD